MFEGIINFFKRKGKKEEKKETSNSRDTAKERLHLVLMQDRANVSADFLELMKQEIIEVIKKYIEIDEGAIDVRLTNKENEDGTNGAPALYANIPILNIKHDVGKVNKNTNDKANTTDNTVEEKKTQSDNVKKGYNKESAEADKKGNDSKTDTGTKPEQKNLEENEKQEEKKQENPVENGEDSKKDKKPVKTESAQEKKEVKSENVKEKE